jgi:hypothetical protein
MANKNSKTPRDYSKEYNAPGSKEQNERNKRKRDKRKHDKLYGECPEGTELHHTNGIENDEVECVPVSKNRGRKEKSRLKDGEIVIRIKRKNAEVKKLKEIDIIYTPKQKKTPRNKNLEQAKREFLQALRQTKVGNLSFKDAQEFDKRMMDVLEKAIDNKIKDIAQDYKVFGKKLEEDYAAGQLLAEEIWNGKFLDSGFDRQKYILECKDNLDEGVLQTFSDVVSYGKQKYNDFKNVADQKLQGFIDKGLDLIIKFFENMRETALKAQGEVGRTLKKLFPKYKTRDLVDIVSVFKQAKYLKIGASIISMILKKAAKLGINAILDAVSGGSTAAARVITSIQDKIEQIKLFIESIKNALDPKGILDQLETIAGIRRGMEFYKELQSDLKNRGPKLDFSGV